MDLRSQLATPIDEKRDLSPHERAERACRLAKQLEKVGEYEAAYEALSEFWPLRTLSPNIEALDQSLKAEILLRVGALAGWLGAVDQIGGSQEEAKNSITKSIQIFA